MSEINFPSDWVACSISDVAQVNPKKIDAEPDTISGFVPMALAPASFSDSLRYEEKHWKEIKKSYTNFQNGDVIFAKVTPCFENGKAAIVDGLPNGIGAGSSEFYVLRPHTPYVLPEILFALIKTQKFANDGAANMTGAVGLRRVPRAFVESFDVPMIPMAEQKVIAEKLDTLLAQVEATKTRLESTLETLKQFRQSVLAAAVSGKLTEDWRRNHGISESTWNESSVDDVCEIAFDGPFGSKLKTADYTNDGIRVARLENIGHLCFHNDKATYISEEKFSELTKNELFSGDVLFSSFVDEEVRVCVFKKLDETFINKADCFCLRPDNTKVKPEILAIILASLNSYQQIKNQVQGVTRPRINLRTLKSLKFQFPSIDEQVEILKYVENLFSGTDATEKQVNQALELVNNLTQSILAKAFRGELTEQWRKENPELISGENSAEALLKKIKAERAAAKPKRKARATSS
ncbi:restriction endonuclease subunit S [Vibrio cholerae]|nr:type I restriction endonuclease subunit S [Vibrio cholerae]EGR1265138.1 type I restriction endonuclease subunit S [Vibrio cholerae]EIA0778011.1 restriction endonuclease subunit S [Vibrio cholerae]EJL6461731.1 restriction endonuclease subunit S [Vibrio cholerae]